MIVVDNRQPLRFPANALSALTAFADSVRYKRAYALYILFLLYLPVQRTQPAGFKKKPNKEKGEKNNEGKGKERSVYKR